MDRRFEIVAPFESDDLKERRTTGRAEIQAAIRVPPHDRYCIPNRMTDIRVCDPVLAC